MESASLKAAMMNTYTYCTVQLGHEGFSLENSNAGGHFQTCCSTEDFRKSSLQPGMVAHSIPATWEAEAEGTGVQGWPGQLIKRQPTSKWSEDI